MADEHRETKRTIWRRASLAWRIWAFVGLAIAVVAAPLVRVATFGFHIGPGDVPPLYSPHPQVFAAWQKQQIVAILIWTACVLVTWFEMAHSGKFAWLWAVSWGLAGAALALALLSLIMQFGLPCVGFAVLALALVASQIWVAAEAQRLSRKTNTNGGQASA